MHSDVESSSPLSPEFQASQWHPKEPGYQPSSSPAPQPTTTIEEVYIYECVVCVYVFECVIMCSIIY